MFKRYTVANLGRRKSVYLIHVNQSEIFLAFTWNPYTAVNDIAGFQSVSLNLLSGNVNIIGRRQVIVIGRT